MIHSDSFSIYWAIAASLALTACQPAPMQEPSPAMKAIQEACTKGDMASCGHIADIEARDDAARQAASAAIFSQMSASSRAQDSSVSDAYWGPQRQTPAYRPTAIRCVDNSLIGATAMNATTCTTN